MGEIRFYEGPEATLHCIGRLSSEVSQQYDLSLISAPVPNQQTNSCTLIGVQPGTKIRLYDHAKPHDDEECAEITVRAFVENKVVPFLNAASSDPEVDVKLRRGQGVQGKVARIEIVSAGS